MSKRMIIISAIGFGVGLFIIGYALYAKYWYTHPPDYTEGTVTVGERAASTSMSGELRAGSTSTSANTPSVLIDGVTFHIDIADTIPKQVQGLSGRASMTADQGMLFIFPFARTPGFWMYDMKFPLDIIWINGNRVVDIQKNAPIPLPGVASSSLPVYYPPGPIDNVLEVNAGTADKYGIKAGDSVDIHI